MSGALLTLNAGSSSMKFALFKVNFSHDVHELCRGIIEKIDIAPQINIHFSDTSPSLQRSWDFVGDPTYEVLLGRLLSWIEHYLQDEPVLAVGHRIVHGGNLYQAPTRIDTHVRRQLASLTTLAPLHQPHNLAAVDAVTALRPSIAQLACFDTAFHHCIADVLSRFPLPRDYADQGLRRYGFHGLSYQYIAERLATMAPRLAAGRVIAAHLGNGASLCAMHAGRSVDTTMGFSTLDGLMMGTRTGTIDPGALLYLLGQGVTTAQLEDLLYRHSGLLGVSQLSADMRELEASGDPRAEEAITMFVHRVAIGVAAMATSLGGVDALVFSAGIGEHSARIRAAVCERLAWLGVQIDPASNAVHAEIISSAASSVEVRVIATDEEVMIARLTCAYLEHETGVLRPPTPPEVIDHECRF